MVIIQEKDILPIVQEENQNLLKLQRKSFQARKPQRIDTLPKIQMPAMNSDLDYISSPKVKVGHKKLPPRREQQTSSSTVYMAKKQTFGLAPFAVSEEKWEEDLPCRQSEYS